MDRSSADSVGTQRLLDQIEAEGFTAFEALFARHTDGLRRMIEMRMSRQLRSRFDVSDVLQETHLEAAERLREYLARRPMPFRLWLRKTAHQCLLRLQRAHAHAKNRAVVREVRLPHRSSFDLAQQLLASGTTPSERVGRSELVRRIHAAVRQLGDKEREVLLMRNFEGLSVREVGCILNVDPGTVSRLHGRALMQLTEILLKGGLTESQL